MDYVTVGSCCNGKLIDNAFAFTEENATCTEDSYSYAAIKGTRQGIELHRGSSRDVSREDVPADNEQAFNVDSGTTTRAHHS